MNTRLFLFAAGSMAAIVERAQVNGDWPLVYELAFRHFLPLVRESGVELEWSDPDTNYEDDVRAFNTALQDKAERLRALVEGRP